MSMAVVSASGIAVDVAEIPWIPMQPRDGSPARSFAKVLHIDEKRNLVIFLNRIVGGTMLPSHVHTCDAMTFTLSGHWGYRDLDLRPGTFGLEPSGTEHAPEYTEDTEALVIFVGDTPELLQTKLPDGRVISASMDMFLELRRAQEQAIAKSS
jgi:hypothetical protein